MLDVVDVVDVFADLEVRQVSRHLEWNSRQPLSPARPGAQATRPAR